MKRKYLLFILVTIFSISMATHCLAADKIYLRIGTSRIAGSYQLWGSTWAKVISDNVEEVSAGIEATAGPAANIKLIEKGINSLGFASVVAAHEGWNGIGWADGIKYQQQRSVFAMYPSYLQLITLKKNNLRTLSDLEGKKVDVGGIGTTPALSMQYVKETLGVNYTMSHNDTKVALAALKQGAIDVFARVTGLPNASIMDLAIGHEIYIVGFSDDELNKLISKYPYFGTSIIPKNVYKKQDYEVNTISVWAIALCDKDLSEDIVYKITKFAFENQDTFIKTHPDGKYLIPENVKYLNIPLHPGALRYYEEVGQEVPGKLIIK